MSRRHADPVAVMRRDDAPEQFLWRERLYLVREVLSHWSESGAWWEGARARAVTQGESVQGESVQGESVQGESVQGESAQGEDGEGELVLTPAPVIEGGEREFWRVEAGRGRAVATGVFDLCFEWSRGQWSLFRVLD